MDRSSHSSVHFYAYALFLHNLVHPKHAHHSKDSRKLKKLIFLYQFFFSDAIDSAIHCKISNWMLILCHFIFFYSCTVLCSFTMYCYIRVKFITAFIWQLTGVKCI